MAWLQNDEAGNGTDTKHVPWLYDHGNTTMCFTRTSSRHIVEKTLSVYIAATLDSHCDTVAMTEGEGMLDRAQAPREGFSAYTPVFNISDDEIDVSGFLRGLTARDPHEAGGATWFVPDESQDISARMRQVRNKTFQISLDLVLPEDSMPNSNAYIHFHDSELTDKEKQLFVSRIPDDDVVAATAEPKYKKNVHGSVWISMMASPWTETCAETELLPKTPVIKTEDEPLHEISGVINSERMQKDLLSKPQQKSASVHARPQVCILDSPTPYMTWTQLCDSTTIGEHEQGSRILAVPGGVSA